MSGEHPAAPDDGASGAAPRREVRVVVPAELQEGWLAFQTGSERRRLAPIPDGWTALEDSALLGLLARARRPSDPHRDGTHG